MIITRFADFFNYWYLQYTLNTAVYMLEPFEVRIVNSILVATIAFCLYSAYVFLPGHAVMLMEFIESCMTYNSSATGSVQGT